MRDDPLHRRQRLEVTGIVQGVGFRPFVSTLARELGLTGFVFNHSAGVTIEVEGPVGPLTDFAARLAADRPPLAHIDRIVVDDVPLQHASEFQILPSDRQAAVSTLVSPDVAPCEECLAEMRDPHNRRFAYPFINCTHCGPRFTIVRDIPYDRPRTTMASFMMCAACLAEYVGPANRRFHAQPNACPACGPRIWFADRGTIPPEELLKPGIGRSPDDLPPLAAFQTAIRHGQIVAVKGVGGFHLACDATSDAAVIRLRARKGRIRKPLAIMVRDLIVARALAEVSVEEERLLTSIARPIVLLKRRPDSQGLSDHVAPGNGYLGVMLPDSPLHHLLAAAHPLLVMTSGNVSEEPIARTNEDALTRLAPLADAFLLHDREIHVACDDSVLRVFEGRELPIRRSRGYAPMPLRLTSTGRSVLAVGGELKVTFCVTKGDFAYMSQHIGDMGNLETLEAFTRGVRHFCDLFRVQPEVMACDLHPGYLSSRWAREYARTASIPLIEVQHHHAHLESLRAEHTYNDPVIGVCFDGTGLGTDGAIWGGEVLRIDDLGFQRLAHLKYVPLPGGDAAIRAPYRAAMAHLWAAGIPWDDDLPCVQACPPAERPVLLHMLEKNLNCPPTSSMGRLFDAVASLIGVQHVVSYEAEAAMKLEALATIEPDDDRYRFPVETTSPWHIDPRPILRAIIHDLRASLSPRQIAGRFHNAVAQLIQDLSRRSREQEGLNVVALSGGVFQNVLLLQLTKQRLDRDHFQTLIHHRVPPNDAGLALGQAKRGQANKELTHC